MTKKTLLISAGAIAVVGGAIAWWALSRSDLPPGFAGGNGRLEAKEINISAKYPGRIKEVLVDEGDTVAAGQVVATIDTEPLEAQLREAQAQITGAEDNRRTALADVDVRTAELNFASSQYKRSSELVGSGAVSGQERDVDFARMESARAALVGSRSQAVRAQAAIDAATATAEKLKAEIADHTLKSPVKARVLARMAEPGEVLGAGGRVLSVTDLSDVYMYVFLPAGSAGKVALGSEARIVLDAIPEYPIRAVVSYVSPTAQFTPKTVETAEERHDLSFRVKLQLDREKLRAYERLVKVGIPGMGYVRYDVDAAWPVALQVRPISETHWAAAEPPEEPEEPE